MAKPRIDENDIIGKVFGKLTVTDYSHRDSHAIYYIAKCSCGNYTVVRRDFLLSGHTQSCGCKVHDPRIENPADIVGQTYGELYVVSLYEDINDPELQGRFDGTEYVYKVRCSCGGYMAVQRSALLCGRMKSCGCLLEKFKAEHDGMTPAQIIKATEARRKERKENARKKRGQ